MKTLNRRQFGIGLAGVAAAATAFTSPLAHSAASEGTQSLAIDDGSFVDINGIEQWITMRGRDARNPVLLWLHGGPGLGMSSSAPLFAAWEHRYTLVQWDQPRSGCTHARNLSRDVGPLTLERFVADGLAVVRHVRKTLGVERLVLMGHSWGSQVGLVMAHRDPELFSAYVGTAQVISGARGRKLGYDLALKAARERKDTAAVEALKRVGPPPYSTFESFLVRQQYTNPPGLPMSTIEQARSAEFTRFLMAPPDPNARYIPRALPQFNVIENFLSTQREMFTEAAKFEAESLGRRFRVPIFFFDGENDLNAPVALAQEYLGRIEAPHKAFRIIAGAGHNTLAFHDELLQLLESEVRPRLG
jgi:pimeloyl-ACP methyl ester carboxylesterase